MEERGHKVLFACPTNKLAQNNRENGITLHQFFGIGMGEHTNRTKFDDSSYDVIVFDEIFFTNVRMLVRIKAYSDATPPRLYWQPEIPANWSR